MDDSRHEAPQANDLFPAVFLNDAGNYSQNGDIFVVLGGSLRGREDRFVREVTSVRTEPPPLPFSSLPPRWPHLNLEESIPARGKSLHFTASVSLGLWYSASRS